MRKSSFKFYRKIYPKARAYAIREYIEPYEIEPRRQGYYHGYVAGVKAMARALRRYKLSKDVIDGRIKEVLGEPKIVKI